MRTTAESVFRVAEALHAVGSNREECQLTPPEGVRPSCCDASPSLWCAVSELCVDSIAVLTSLSSALNVVTWWVFSSANAGNGSRPGVFVFAEDMRFATFGRDASSTGDAGVLSSP